MRHPDGYTGMGDMYELNRALESALADNDPTPAGDEIVRDMVIALRSEATLAPPADAASHIAAAAAGVRKGATRSETLSRAPGRARQGRLRRRAVVLATTLGLLVATAGMGLAANHSFPGQALYGIDVALEKWGIFDGGPSERAHEVMQLLETEQTGLALGHAAATVASLPPQALGGGAAAEDLDFAAQEIGNLGDPAPEAVEALIAYLAAHIGNTDGGVVGETVADLAEAIKDSVLSGVPPVTVPGGPPGTTPGPPITVPGPPG